MSIQVGIPKAAMNSLSDMVDNVAEVKPGMQVLILAAKDGLYNGDNLVDEEAVAWTASVLESRGATCFIMWYDDTSSKHDWKYPAILKAAVPFVHMKALMSRNARQPMPDKCFTTCLHITLGLRARGKKPASFSRGGLHDHAVIQKHSRLYQEQHDDE